MISRRRILEVNSTAIDLWMEERNIVKWKFNLKSVEEGVEKCKCVKYSRPRRLAVHYLHLKWPVWKRLGNKLEDRMRSCPTSTALLRTLVHEHRNCN